MPDLCSTFGKKIMSCHVRTYVSYEIRTRADRAERAWIEQSARGSNRAPTDGMPPNTRVRICRNTRKRTQYVVYSGPSTEYVNSQANMKKYENAQYVSFLVYHFFFVFFFQFSDVASLASIPKRDLVLKWQHGFRICLNSFLKN
jgi:hypothetical protein